MSLLPAQIIPYEEPIGEVNQDGTVTITKNWWLLFFNLCKLTLGTPGSSGGGGIPTDNLTLLQAADVDATDTDATVLRLPISNLEKRVQDDYTPSASELPDIARALLLAQDPLLPDPAPLAQPVAAVTPSGSPFTYTAPFSGVVAVTGGTVSGIALVRQGTSTATGVTTGLLPVSRYDQVVVTYSAAPTMTFIPGGS